MNHILQTRETISTPMTNYSPGAGLSEAILEIITLKNLPLCPVIRKRVNPEHVYS
jgi:hypothetical protein